MVRFELVFFFQAEDGIRGLVRSRGLGDVYKRQVVNREVVAELPAAQHERPVIDPLHGKGLQVVQGLSLIHI